MIVMKFGGSSLAGPEHLRRVAGLVHARLRQQPIVVLSAMGKTTNELIKAADRAQGSGERDISKVCELTTGVLEELRVPVPDDIKKLLKDLDLVIEGISLLREVSSRTRDMVVSFGERLSVRVFAEVYNSMYTVGSAENHIQAKALDSWELGVQTSSGAGSASSTFSEVEVLPETYGAIAEYVSPLREDYSFVPVVTGYIAKDKEGIITTLGRDGSDLTATVIGAAINASEVQIWKDVDGVLTTDPRVVPEARKLELLTFEEASELTVFGANVVHPAAIMPAWDGGVPITVRNSIKPHSKGTRIISELSDQHIEERRSTRVVAMSSKTKITMITIRSTRMLGQHGFLAHVFQIFKKFEASVDVIATSEITVSLTLDVGFKPINITGLCEELKIVADVEVKRNMSMLTLITPKSESNRVLKECFQSFDEHNVEVEMLSHGASSVNVTFVLPDSDLKDCIQNLHRVFFES